MKMEMKVDWTMFDTSPELVRLFHKYFLENPMEFPSRHRIAEKELYRAFNELLHIDIAQACLLYLRVLDNSGILNNHSLVQKGGEWVVQKV